jgi:carbonic anhydrase
MKKLILISLLLCSTQAFALTDDEKNILSKSKEKIVQGTKAIVADFNKDEKLKNDIKEKIIEKKDKIKSKLENLKESPLKQKILKEYILHKFKQNDQK